MSLWKQNCAQTSPKLHLDVISCKAIGPNGDVPACCATISVEIYGGLPYMALHQLVLWAVGPVVIAAHVSCIAAKRKLIPMQRTNATHPKALWMPHNSQDLDRKL